MSKKSPADSGQPRLAFAQDEARLPLAEFIGVNVSHDRSGCGARRPPGCAEGEDAFHTRRGDVLTPVAFHKNRALASMLRHHQVPTENERNACVANGSVHSLAQSLREVRWENLARRMERHGNQCSGDPKLRLPT